MQAAQITITARRNARYVERFEFKDEDGVPLDFVGATAEMHVRLYGNAAGAPLLDLNDVPSVQEGVHRGSDGSITISIDSPVLLTMPQTDEVGKDSVFVYDVRIIYSTGISDVLMEGPFILKPGVTR